LKKTRKTKRTRIIKEFKVPSVKYQSNGTRSRKLKKKAISKTTFSSRKSVVELMAQSAKLK
jgi:hypothetical protein